MAILGITSTKNFGLNENLFNQNDPSDGLYALLSGKLQIYIFSGFSGKPQRSLPNSAQVNMLERWAYWMDKLAPPQ
jgi:hypothetical protein